MLWIYHFITIYAALIFPQFRLGNYALPAAFSANATAGTSSSSFKIGGSGPTGVMLKGLISR